MLTLAARVGILSFVFGASPTPAPRTVTFQTSDGVTIAADFWAPTVKKGAKTKSPVAILIHMYPADRKSWAPLVPALHEAGFAVLAYDIRGRGGSTEPREKNLRKMYDGRDPALFADAWKDVEGARKWLAAQPACDVTRMALVGASIGCSISLDYAGRDSDVRAVVCLSPGTNYFGVDSVAHIRKCGRRAILLIAPEAEYDAVEKLIEASGGVARGAKHPGGRERHGTNMLAADYADSGKIRARIVDFVRAAAELPRKAG